MFSLQGGGSRELKGNKERERDNNNKNNNKMEYYLGQDWEKKNGRVKKKKEGKTRK